MEFHVKIYSKERSNENTKLQVIFCKIKFIKCQ